MFYGSKKKKEKKKNCIEIANKCFISDKNINIGIASVKDGTNVTAKCKGTTADKQCDFNYKITKVMSGIS